ncbi:hypothetical protein [Halalkalibacterium ligniniphilum]|uniref:hypothetical protein n=1 Tax=Halalkalibacterium ligniniphilum TaxID=1134413 RepID=UPI000376DC81|nr:hypothetical protein [Halalkalibacterium ligniniphilum]
MTDYYKMCCQYKGELVTIVEKSGRRHVGRIMNVDHQYVYLDPVHPGRGYGGFSYGYGFYPYYRPFFPIALAAIGGFALGASLFWI